MIWWCATGDALQVFHNFHCFSLCFIVFHCISSFFSHNFSFFSHSFHCFCIILSLFFIVVSSFFLLMAFVALVVLVWLSTVVAFLPFALFRGVKVHLWGSDMPKLSSLYVSFNSCYIQFLGPCLWQCLTLCSADCILGKLDMRLSAVYVCTLWKLVPFRDVWSTLHPCHDPPADKNRQ